MNQIGRPWAIGPGATVLLSWLWLAGTPALAADPTTCTVTGYAIGVPVPGVLCTNAAGQVFLKGNVHVLRVQATDARMTGRLQAGMDLSSQADGTSTFGGRAYLEVGTWDLKDPANPKFTRTDGVWDMTYQGTAQVDGSDVLKVTGYGIGGTIDGLRAEGTLTKGPGVPFDPAVPYMGSARILPAPVTNIDVIGNFDDGVVPNWPRDVGNRNSGTGVLTPSVANGQLTLRGVWSKPTHTPHETGGWVWPSKSWALNPGQTLEARVDLVKINQSASGAILAIYNEPGTWGGYGMLKGRDYVCVVKDNLDSITFFSAEKVTTQNANEILALALTPAGQNVIVTARVLDRSSGAVLYQRSVTETPASDLSLTAGEVATQTGMTLQDLQRDPSGPPWTSGSALMLAVMQYGDGKLPAAEATFDNFELRTYDLPPVGIESVLLLTYPAPATQNFQIQQAPSVDGPWSPYTPPALPGLPQMIIRKDGAMGFYRVVPAP